MDTHHVNTEEENISQMDACCSFVGDQIRPTSHNFKRTTNIESLPDYVLLDILFRVPAADIYSAASLVCRKWYQTTRTHDFVHAHLQQSSCGLICSPGDKTLLFATFPKGRGIIEKTNYKFTGVVALSSCNGLILELHKKKAKLGFRVTNPAMKKHLDLPSCGPNTTFYNSAIACAVASKDYKVIRSFYSKSGGRECAILTVGVDEDWKRRVDIQHLSPRVKELLGQIAPLSADGFVHWANNGRGRFPEYVLTLNVETEIITQFPAVPPSLLCGGGGETKLLMYHYLPMGSYLSLLIGRIDKFATIWDQVWVMKPETGEWTKMTSIDLESQKRAFEGVSASLNFKLEPVAWLKFREVLVFRSSYLSPRTGLCIVYNVRTHEIESFDQLGSGPQKYIAHRNSLIWLDGWHYCLTSLFSNIGSGFLRIFEKVFELFKT